MYNRQVQLGEEVALLQWCCGSTNLRSTRTVRCSMTIFFWIFFTALEQLDFLQTRFTTHSRVEQQQQEQQQNIKNPTR